MFPRLSLLAGLTLGLPCAAFELRHDSQGDVVAWQDHVDFVIDAQLAIQLDEPRADGAIAAAIAVIDNATPQLVVRAHVAKAQALGYRPDASDNENDIIAITEDWPWEEKALAATVVTLNSRTNQIVDADIAINAASHHFRVVDTMPASERDHAFDDVQNTLTHELGHALGLMHNTSDATVVMFPSAAPLEISKRTLAKDDRAGLAALYSADKVVSADPTPVAIAGCSSAGSGGGTLALLAAVVFLLGARRSRNVVIAGAVLSGFAALAEDARLPDVDSVEHIAVAEVTARTSQRLASNPGLIVTELTLTTRDCVKGACSTISTVRVYGGKVGDYEQVIDHEPVPALAAAVLVTSTRRHAQVLSLDDERCARVSAKLRAAGLPVPGSLAPHGGAQTRTAAP
jgi:uncharacterized protein (TIGR03382 family)